MADRPNIILIMADQLSAGALPVYGNKVVKAPNLTRLAERSTIFDNAYCAFPLCGPSRAALVSGRLCSKIGAFDNACELPAATPTMMHHLRLRGYSTCASGKMHFIGPDQMHGLERRLTNDVYPADFAWIPDWSNTDPRLAFQDMTNVVEAGPCLRSMQLEFDEMTFNQAASEIYDLARSGREEPFFLWVSFTHPHDPYVMTPEFWDMYSSEEIDEPSTPFIEEEQRDSHSRRLFRHYGMDRVVPDRDQVKRARHGYYAAISYLDDRIGKLLDLLEATGLQSNTAVVFTSDHGDMLGERGMWYKKSFYDRSLRVPLFIAHPGGLSSRCGDPVSHLDLLPTFVELAGGNASDAQPCDGQSLIPFLHGSGDAGHAPVLAEYLAEGVDHPLFMIRDKQFKFIWSEVDPPLLFDMERDPGETENLAHNAEYQAVVQSFLEQVSMHWDPAGLREKIIRDQGRRRLVRAARASGSDGEWDFTPGAESWPRFVRSGDWTAEVEAAYFLPLRPQ